MEEPSPALIKKLVEDSTNFVDWLSEVLAGKNPVKKLLLLDAVLFVFCNPLFFPGFVERVTGKAIKGYAWIFWTTVGMVFVAAVIAAIRVKRTQTKSTSGPNEHSAIKGLLPFGKADAKLFSRLQREESFRECLPVLTNNDFRFGVLCGESGSGKTSFLQASLWPRLLEQGHRCLYVKFTDLDPLDSVRSALVEQFNLPREAIDDADLLTMLETAVQIDGQPVILLFDQFEQFFVHRKRERQRKPFVQALAAWYRKQPPLPCRLLLCLREDFAGRLVELQKAMGYSLGPQQSFRLEKFEPETAAKIFRVIAETENARFDETFVDEFAQQELASRDDGLVSPVDIQLIAWMIAAQPAQQGRAFDRASFQKIGGLEGLLETFLKRALEARETDSRRQSAIKVLLALTDLDGNARAGVLTLEALREKLAGTASNTEVEEAVGWLSRADVRLVNSMDEGYELAHERLIPALRRVGGNALSIADQANQLLDRRVNEWLGNNRATRYLLTWREWKLIETQRPYLVWGAKKTLKEALLAQTRRRRRVLIAAVSLPLVLASLAGISYLAWRRSEAGQIYQIKRDLLSLSEGINKKTDLDVVVESFVFAGMSQQAFQVADGVKDPKANADLLSAIAVATVQSSQSAGSIDRALETARRIDDPNSKSEALGEIVDVLSRVATEKQSIELLDRALEITRDIAETGRIKSRALRSIAVAFARIATVKQSGELLDRAFEIARGIDKGIDDATDKVTALNAIAEAMTRVDFKHSAELFDQIVEANSDLRFSASTVISFNNLINAISKRDDPSAADVLSRATELAAKVNAPEYRASALSTLAVASAKKDSRLSSHLLNQAIDGAKRNSDPSYKALALKTVAEAILDTDPKRAAQLLKEASVAAMGISVDSRGGEADDLIDVSTTIAKIATNHHSSEFFAQAVGLASDDISKLAITRLVTHEKTRIASDPTPDILRQAIMLAEGINGFSYRAEALSLFAKVVAKTDSDQAAKLLNQVFLLLPIVKREKKDRPELPSGIPTTEIADAIILIDLTRSPETGDQALELVKEIRENNEKVIILIAVAEATAKFDVARSTELFNQAIKIANNGKVDLNQLVRSIARAAAVAHSPALLDKAVEVGREINDYSARPEALNAVAGTAVRLNDLRVARDVALMNNDIENKSKTLALVLKTWAVLRNPDLEKWDQKKE